MYWLMIKSDDYDEVDRVIVESKRFINGGKGGYDKVRKIEYFDVLDLDDVLRYQIMREKKKSFLDEYLNGN